MSASTIIKKDKPNEPEYKKLDNQVKFSFMITYTLLLTTATITFIEAMRTTNPNVRHVLNLELQSPSALPLLWQPKLSMLNLVQERYH